MYYHGHGLKQDYAQSVKWHRKAAEQGHADAQFYLGYMNDKSQGVKQNCAGAFKWYSKFAQQGHADA